MSKAEILAEIPRLTREEREDVARKLAECNGDAWLDSDDPLTVEEKALLEARLADMEANPTASIPLEEAKKRILQELEILQTTVVPDLEFQQAVNYLKGTFILDHQTNSQRAHYQGWWEIMGLPTDFDTQYPALMSSATPRDVFAVTKKMFGNPFVTIETLPKNA